MEEKTFYDIHMHAFNLSHPDLIGFVSRFKRDFIKIQLLTIVGGILPFFLHIPIIGRFIWRIIRRILNLLAIMDKDIGNFFLTTEDCMRENENPLLDDDGLHIGGNTYKQLVLTPLIMDFGRRTSKLLDLEEDEHKREQLIHYWRLTGKSIVGQVIDVFNGIKKYKDPPPDMSLSEKYKALTPNTYRILEIYPFLGINTQNYTMEQIKTMMDKYFSEYVGSRGDLRKTMGQFDGDIEHIGSNSFAGIKVYPPLGFDPWPVDNLRELEKVKYLYQYCEDKCIPITCHGSKGGFAVLGDKQLKNYTRISKWNEVTINYPELKLNLAHFPVNEKWLWIFPRKKRLNEILNLVINQRNVYVDFSNRAINDKYYKSLRKVIDILKDEEKIKVIDRILFGSDFTVNLLSVESYNKYLDIFSKSKYLTPEEKDCFCCSNPERFLFSQTK